MKENVAVSGYDLLILFVWPLICSLLVVSLIVFKMDRLEDRIRELENDAAEDHGFAPRMYR